MSLWEFHATCAGFRKFHTVSGDKKEIKISAPSDDEYYDTVERLNNLI